MNIGPSSNLSSERKLAVRNSINAAHAVYADAADWVGSTVLTAGQFGIETDTGKHKIGNGTTEWSSLSYASVAELGFTPADSATNTGDETTSTILNKIKGAAADPDRIGAEYLPLVVEADYVELTDQTGETIPPNSLGRKGTVPYFGNSPLINGETVVFDEEMTTGASPSRVELVSFAVAAESMVVGAQYNLIADIYIDFITDAPAAQDVILQLDFGEQTDFTGAESLIVPLTAARLQKIRIEGIIAFANSSGDIVLSCAGLRGIVMNSDYAAATNAALTGKIFENGTDIVENPMLPVTAAVANTIKLWAYNLTLAAAKQIQFRGSASLTSI